MIPKEEAAISSPSSPKEEWAGDEAEVGLAAPKEGLDHLEAVASEDHSEEEAASEGEAQEGFSDQD